MTCDVKKNALMIKERYGIDIPYGLIVVLIPEEIEPQIIIFKIKEYEHKVRDIFKWAKEHLVS